MENILEKINEFYNYLLLVNNNEDHKKLIIALFEKNNNYNLLLFVKMLRLEDETENKEELVIDENGEEKIIKRYSQINTFINVFGLSNNEEVKNKLKEYLDYFISVQNQINL